MARSTPKHTISYILYDVVYDIVCLVYDIVCLTYDVVYEIVYDVVYKNGKNLYHAHTISYILYDIVYDIVCLLNNIVYDVVYYFVIRYRTFNIRYLMLETRCRIRYRILA